MIKLYDPFVEDIFYAVKALAGIMANNRDIGMLMRHIEVYASGIQMFDGYTVRWDEPDNTGRTPVYITA